MNSSSTSRWRLLLPSLLLFTLSMVLMLVFAELVIRLLAPQPLPVATPGLYESDEPRRFRLRAGHAGEVSNGTEFNTSVEISAQGLRDTPVLEEERPRLLVIGDSYIFGWGVERDEAIAYQLGERLDGVRVINAGTPGFGLPDEVDWLEAHGLALEPDAIVVAVFLGNDLLDATAEHREVVISDGLVAETGAATGVRAGAVARSHLLRLLKGVVPPGLQLSLRERLGMPPPRTLAYLRESLEIYAVDVPPLIQEGRAATAVAFDRLMRIAEREDLRVAMILIPSPLQVDAERWSYTLGQLTAADDPVAHAADAKDRATAYDPEVPGRFFTSLARERDVPVLDLSPIFSGALSANPRQSLFFVHDPHWTRAGHQLAAEHTARFLLEQGIDFGEP